MSTQENSERSTASRENQATLGDFGATSPALYPDGYGPTMDRPIPSAEEMEMRLPGTDAVDRRELEETGLAPSDFEILNGAWSPQVAGRRGFHPDDETRPDRREEEAGILEPRP